MKHPDPRKELLISLASKGDPWAFYSLIEEHVSVAYDALRSAGKTHNETTLAISKIVQKGFTSFEQSSSRTTTLEWIENQLDKITPATPSVPTSTEDVTAERTIFLNFTQLQLQRAYSKLKKSGYSGTQFRFASFLHKHPIGRRLVTLLLIVVMFFALHIYLINSNSKVALSYTSPYLQTLFMLPPDSTGIVSISFKSEMIRSSFSNSLKPADESLPAKVDSAISYTQPNKTNSLTPAGTRDTVAKTLAQPLQPKPTPVETSGKTTTPATTRESAIAVTPTLKPVPVKPAIQLPAPVPATEPLTPTGDTINQ